MKHPLIAFDMSSFIWRGLLAGKDGENGKRVIFDDKEVWVNSGGYGYNFVVDKMLEVMRFYGATPIDTVLVYEGMNSKSRRQLISSAYKATRDARPPEAYEQFEVCKKMLADVWLGAGACAMTQDYAEGDDTLAYLAKETERDLVIASYDGDLLALNTDANAYGAEIEVWRDGYRGINKYGDFPHHLITSYKALVGDSTEYPGCKGFGPASFNKFIDEFGIDGLQEFQDLCEKSSLDPIHAVESKLAQMICSQEEQVLTSYELAKLRPEWVNTMTHPLKIERGIVKMADTNTDDRLIKWYGKAWLVTGEQFDSATKFLLSKVQDTEEVGLDIETSTPDASDEWLAVRGADKGVDVFGSELTGLSLTFGDNNQYTMYFSVRHADTDNVDSAKLAELIYSIKQKLVIQNLSFELTVLFQEWGTKFLQWDSLPGGRDSRGFLCDVLDTALEASYVDENNSRGLKERSLSVLGYRQQTYDEVTQVTDVPEKLPKGGKFVSEQSEVITQTECGIPQICPTTQTRRYKMRELSAAHVFSYGTDDTRCTMGLHNHYKLVMQLEHTWQTYLKVEIDAAYAHAHMFLTGVIISIEKMNELSRLDDQTYNENWAIVREYLIANKWEGTTPPVYTSDVTAAQIKEAYQTVTGEKLETLVRTPSKLVTLTSEKQPIFSEMLSRCLAGAEGAQQFTAYVCEHFKGEPQFSDASTKEMQHLLYDVMGLPIRVRNKLTAAAKAKGETQGSAKTDALAIDYALRDADESQKSVLNALKLMAMVGTRRSLYYGKYPGFPHWKDGKVHSSHNQCGANTRRATSSDPNLQQLPKHPKIEGHASRFREVIVPHHAKAVIVSLDFDSQELRVIADYSKDPNMVSCYVGDNLRGMHELTGMTIYERESGTLMSYEAYTAALKDESCPEHKEVKRTRTLGKKVNFTAEYGAMAPKLAQTLLIDESVAQIYLDAREATFPVAAAWKLSVVREAHENGFVMTKLGARRHLRDTIMGEDRWAASKADRQAVNFEIQSSCAEMTKLAEGAAWRDRLVDRFDCRYIGPIHDETVWSVAISDLEGFIPALHACMTQPYADMEIPIESSISFGPNFYQQIEIGLKPTKEAIEKGLEKMYAIILKGKKHER